MSNTVWNILNLLKVPPDETNFIFLILNRPIICNANLVMSLWKKACLRAIADGGANRWVEFIQNNKSEDLELPDFISGDFDSIKPKTMAYFKTKTVRLISTPCQDDTDFTKSLRCIAEIANTKELTAKFVFALCEPSGRFDQVIGNISTLHRSKNILPNIPVIILSSRNVTWVLSPGTHIILVSDDFIQKHYSCGILPFCGPTVVTTSGLKWNLTNQILAMDGLVSTSNTFLSKEVHITCNLDVVWTMEYHHMHS